jgi:DNA-binding SARP family transcriptional activator
MTELSLRLLGGFEARLGKTALRLPRKARALLGYLALAGGGAVPRAELAALLWDEREDARNSLRQALFHLRRALGPLGRLLVLHGDTVALRPDALDVDARRFEALAAGGGETALSQAVGLYRGDLLAGLDVGTEAFEDWLRGQRAWLHERGVDVCRRLLEAQLDRGALEDAIRTALRLLALDPLHEGAHRALMRAYAGTGRRAAALRQYQVCLAALEREVQAGPEPETRRLYVQILQEPSPAEAAPRPAHRLGAPRGPRTFASPPVGREIEIAQLRRAVGETAAGRGTLALVLGDAGVGKSRVAVELLGEVVGSGWLVLEGRGYPSERDLPLAPWVDALRAVAVEHASAIGRLPPAWRHALLPLFPQLAHASPLRPGTPRPSENQRRLFEGLWHLLGALAEEQPLLVLLEDLHWMDATSLRFLAFLARRLEGVRACVIATARLDEADADGSTLRAILAELRADGRPLEVRLAPLSRPQTRQLVEMLAPRHRPLSPQEIERIWEMSEGSPFVVIEALRSLEAAGAERDGAGLALPEGVRRLILDRVARLSAQASRTVAAASVIGRDFDHVLVGRVTEIGSDESAAAFEELVRARLLHQRGAGFEFAHERVREAVYDSLLPPRRRLLHASVTRTLETLHAGELEPHYGALAHHAREGGLWVEAVEYLRQGSAVVTARGALREAVGMLEQALALLPALSPARSTTELACDVRLGLGDRAIVVGDFGRAEAVLLEALALADELGDERRAALGRAALAQRDAFARKLDRGFGLAAEALATAERLGESTLETRAAMAIGIVRTSRGEHPAAIADFERVLRAAGDDPLTSETIGLGLCHVGGRAWKALALAELGRFEEALALGHDALARADAARHVFSMARSRLGLGRIHLLRGDLEPAIASLVASDDLVARYEIGFIQRGCAVMLASARVQAGLAAAADVAWPRPRTSAVLVVAESEALLAARRWEPALAAAGDALAIARAGGERGVEAWALMLLGEAHAGGAGVTSPARPAYEEALAIATALGLRPLEAHCRRGLGRLLAQSVEPVAAADQLVAALALYEDMGMAWWIEPTRAALHRAALPARGTDRPALEPTLRALG